jgi:DNA-binding NtrC family response regulator
MSDAVAGNDPRSSDGLRLIAFAERTAREVVRGQLARLGYAVREQGAQEAMRDAAHGKLAVVLVDGKVPADDELRQLLPRLTVAPVFGIFDAARCQPAYTDRCIDFVCWPCRVEELAVRLQRFGCNAAPRSAREHEGGAWLGTSNLIGRAPEFLNSCRRLARFARCDAPVLIEGETGTGKDLGARAVHCQSARAERAFVPVNCGAIPDALIENELFGHEAGAYTGARHGQAGLVAQAEGGSLFLDEVEALSAKGQAALLRLLEQQEYRPLGGGRLRKSDVRIIAASNVSLARLAERGEFRSDLYFRLNILSARLPPLRARPGDVMLLSEHFLRRFATRYGGQPKRLHPTTLGWMLRYPWPGNVRELEALLHREYLLADETVMRIGMPQLGAGEAASQADPGERYYQMNLSAAKSKLVEDFERRYLSRVIAAAGGNVTRAATIAGKERRALGKLMKKHGIARAISDADSLP